MRVVITGATGTIGLALADALRNRGDDGVAPSRAPQRRPGGGGGGGGGGRRAVRHLRGEPVGQRWTEESKRRIRESRVNSTRSLVAGLGSLAEADRPRVLV